MILKKSISIYEYLISSYYYKHLSSPSIFGQPPSQLGGVDLPIIAYRDAIGARLQPASIYKPSGKWLLLSSDISAYRGYRALGELSFFSWITSLFQVRYCVEFAYNDMGPFLFLIRKTFNRVFRKIIANAKLDR